MDQNETRNEQKSKVVGIWEGTAMSELSSEELEMVGGAGTLVESCDSAGHCYRKKDV